MTEEKKATEATNTQEAAQQGPEFAIQRIYIKDLSLEVANSPQVFLEKWELELNLDVHTATNKVDENLHEVVLTLTVTVKLKEKTAFLVEVKQGGIFSMKGFGDTEMRPMLGAYCPNLLYPYARQTVTDVVTQAGFPQLYLQHINFDALYQQHEQENTKAGGSES